MRERRRLRRHYRRIPVRFAAEGRAGSGVVRNLSRAGLFVASESLPPRGSAIVVELLHGSVPVKVRGVVRWTTDDQPERRPGDRGFGLEILEAGPDWTRLYERILLGA